MTYRDPYTQAYASALDYSNLLGVSLKQGEGYYSDLFYKTGGSYINYSSPNTGFAFDKAFAQSPFEIATHVSGSVVMPWASYGTSIDTINAAGLTATLFGVMPSTSSGLSVAHAAYGTPTVFNLAGLHPDVAGQLAVHAYSPETAAMDRYLSNQYMYTEQGMPFIANTSYYNPDSLWGSNWYFPGKISYLDAGTETVGGASSGYVVSQELLGATPGSFPSYTGSGWPGPTASSTGSGWSGPTAVGWVGSTAGANIVSGGWSTGATGGWPGGGFTTGAGTTMSGWPSYSAPAAP
jgi:hypothetical protein